MEPADDPQEWMVRLRWPDGVRCPGCGDGRGARRRRASAAARRIEELPALPAARRRENDDRIPAEFWDCFWSGAPARDLRISTDGLYIAEALINGRDPHARAWALNALPVETLRECRKLRGCDTGTPKRWLDCAIRERTDA